MLSINLFFSKSTQYRTAFIAFSVLSESLLRDRLEQIILQEESTGYHLHSHAGSFGCQTDGSGLHGLLFLLGSGCADQHLVWRTATERYETHYILNKEICFLSPTHLYGKRLKQNDSSQLWYLLSLVIKSQI